MNRKILSNILFGKSNLYIALIIFLSVNLSAYNQGNTWYFGYNAGLSFKSGSPVALTDGKLRQWEGCSIISDEDGNFLFYTNGSTIWNKSHRVMTNGSGLAGHNSSTQSAVIVPKPGKENKYYVFTTPAQLMPGGFCYSIVDMNLQSGLGEVIQKNVKLLDTCTEKVAAVFHSNKKDIWIVTHEWNTNAFRAYLLTENGLSNPVISYTGSVHTGASSATLGYLKFSPDGTRLACPMYSMKMFELFDFDASTGIISNPMTFSSDIFNGCYGVEFSPDMTKLYISKMIAPSALYQLNLQAGSVQNIISTAVKLAEHRDRFIYGAVQIAPDGKIYVAKDEQYSISVINKPNTLGTGCDYSDGSVNLGGMKSGLGLPNIMQSYFGAMNVTASTNQPICEGQEILLFASGSAEDSYTWRGPNGFTSNNQNPVIKNVSLSMAGTYTVTARNSRGMTATASIEVGINALPKPFAGKDVQICFGSATKIGSSLSGDGSPFIYSWSPTKGLNSSDKPEPVAAPEETTSYILAVTNIYGCTNYDTILVTVNPLPVINAGEDITICKGDAVMIGNPASKGAAPFKYSWKPRTGLADTTSYSTLAFPTVTTNYILTLTDANGCNKSDTITIFVNQNPSIFAGEDRKVCYAEQIQIGNLANGGKPPYRYEWKPGKFLSDSTAAMPILSPTESIKYSVTVTDDNGCSSTDNISITVNPELKLNAGNNLVVCPDSVVKLNAIISGGQEPYNETMWYPQTGLQIYNSPKTELKLSNPGNYMYIFTVTDASNCTVTDSIKVIVLSTPKVSLSKSFIDFGKLDGCASFKTDSFLITNEGNETVTLDCNISNNVFKIVSPKFPISLKKGEKKSIIVTYNPDGEGIEESEINFETSPCLSFKNIKLMGEKEKLLLNVSQKSHDFGLSNLCETSLKETEIELTNNGTSEITLEFDKIKINKPFIIENNLPVKIGIKEKAILKIKFSPDSEGEFSENISIPYNSGECIDSISISLKAIAAIPVININSTDIQIPVLSGCTEYYDTLITIQNESLFPVVIKSLSNSDIISILEKLPLEIAPKTTIQIKVRVSPKLQGVFSENILFQIEPCKNNFNINISGEKLGIIVKTLNEIIFDDLIICKDNSKTQRFAIINNSSGNSDINIENITVSGPFKINLNGNESIKSGDSIITDIIFEPDETIAFGNITGEIKITFKPCDISKTILLKSTKLKAELTGGGILDFGEIKDGDSKYLTTSFTNSGMVDITIERIESPVEPFFIKNMNFELPAILKPGNILNVEIGCKGVPGNYTGSLTVQSDNPCNLQATTILKANCNFIPGKTVVMLPVIQSEPGKLIEVPLKLLKYKDIQLSELNKFSCSISFNKYLLEPLNQDYEIEGKLCRINLINDYSENSETIKTLTFKVLLGDTNFTELTIEDFQWEDKKIAVEKINGGVILNDNCIGTQRYVKDGTGLILSGNSPNPFDNVTFIEFISDLNEEIELYIIDQLGKKVKTIFNGVPQKGINKIPFYSAELASGVYYAVLKSTTDLQVLRMNLLNK